jgi:hypothetical protein
MVRTRSFLVAAIALGLGVGACKKKEEAKGNTADKTTEQKAGENPVTKPAPGAGVIQGADDLSLLPADSEVVMGLNFAQLQQSALWKQYGTKLIEKASKELAEFKSACGFDPVEQIKSVSVGMKGIDAGGGGGKKPEGALVIHGLDKTKSLACIDKAKAEAAKKGSDITRDGDVFTIKDKSGDVTAWTFVNNDTLLGVLGPTASKDTLLAAAKGTSTLKSSQTFVDMYSKINTKESLWLLINGNAPFMAKAASAGFKPKAMFGSLNVTDGLTVDFRIRVATPDEATQLVNMMKGQTNNPQMKQMFDKFDIAADGTDAKIQIAMSQEKLKNLVQMAAGMMGGMMGGGMGGP